MVADMPDARSRTAEEIRRHLVALRGGGPFLSPDDAELLAKWLDAGVTSPVIVHALELAAQARAKRPSRIPLSLKHARRYLNKPGRGALGASQAASKTGEHPLQPLADAVLRNLSDDPGADAARTLVEALLDLPGHDRVLLEERAQALIRDFFLSSWTSMADWEREARLTTAREELGDLAAHLSPEALEASCEAIARDHLRRAWPTLSAATVHQVLNS